MKGDESQTSGPENHNLQPNAEQAAALKREKAAKRAKAKITRIRNVMFGFMVGLFTGVLVGRGLQQVPSTNNSQRQEPSVSKQLPESGPGKKEKIDGINMMELEKFEKESSDLQVQ